MTNQQDRRERIAAQVLASIIASDKGYTLRVDVEHAIRAADELIAELDRTATPSNQPESPEGWIVWDDFSGRKFPIRDSVGQWLHRIKPWGNRAEAKALADELGCRVRKWPLDPAEDKEVQS